MGPRLSPTSFLPSQAVPGHVSGWDWRWGLRGGVLLGSSLGMGGHRASSAHAGRGEWAGGALAEGPQLLALARPWPSPELEQAGSSQRFLRARSLTKLLLLHPSPTNPTRGTDMRHGDPLPCAIVDPAVSPSAPGLGGLCCSELRQTASAHVPRGGPGELELGLLPGLGGSVLCFLAGGEGLRSASHPGEPTAGVGAAEQWQCSCLPGWVSERSARGLGERGCVLLPLHLTGAMPAERPARSSSLCMSCSSSCGLRGPFLACPALQLGEAELEPG